MRKAESIIHTAAATMRAAAELWCGLAHDDITWPSRGYYRCRKCHRQYAVPWDEPGNLRDGRRRGAHSRKVTSTETVPA